MPASLACSYAALCSGCDWLSKPYEEQRDLKIQHLQQIWAGAGLSANQLPAIGWDGIHVGGLRDRMDLMIDQRSGGYRLGLFDRHRTGIVDLQGCPQLSPALEDWLLEFRKIKIPVERGSVRLRVSPSGARGVWLDLANIDVKRLLEERTTLDQLRSQAVVEIGQKRKRLVEREGQLKLADAILEPWFETYLDDESAVPLYCTIGSFTQPGFRANRHLVRQVRKLVRDTGAKKAAEFGSGIGNFTLPLASVCSEVHAYEIDSLALEGLKRSLNERGLEERVQIFSGNFQVERKQPVDFAGADLILVDPPRSGLMKFLDPLEMLAPERRAKSFVYVSCFAESFAADSKRLLEMGYQMTQAAIVDQFPQSRHYEVVASFTR